VALLDRGRLLALDDPDSLRKALPGTVVEVIAVPQEAAATALSVVPGVVDVERYGERIHVRIGPGQPAGEAALGQALKAAGVEASVVRLVPASLEDVFISRLAEVRFDRAEPRER